MEVLSPVWTPGEGMAGSQAQQRLFYHQYQCLAEDAPQWENNCLVCMRPQAPTQPQEKIRSFSSAESDSVLSLTHGDHRTEASLLGGVSHTSLYKQFPRGKKLTLTKPLKE